VEVVLGEAVASGVLVEVPRVGADPAAAGNNWNCRLPMGNCRLKTRFGNLFHCLSAIDNNLSAIITSRERAL